MPTQAPENAATIILVVETSNTIAGGARIVVEDRVNVVALTVKETDLVLPTVSKVATLKLHKFHNLLINNSSSLLVSLSL